MNTTMFARSVHLNLSLIVSLLVILANNFDALGAGSKPTAPVTITPLSGTQLLADVTYIGAIRDGFVGFQNPQDFYLTATTSSTVNNLTIGPNGAVGSFYFPSPWSYEDNWTADSNTVGQDPYGNTFTLSNPWTLAAFESNTESSVPPFPGSWDASSTTLIMDLVPVVSSINPKYQPSSYTIYKLQYLWKVNSDPNLVLLWDVPFTPCDDMDSFLPIGPVQHTFISWATRGATQSPVYIIDPTQLNDKQNGTYFVQPIEALLAVDGYQPTGYLNTNQTNQTTQTEPYRFWLNNNEDRASTSILFGTSPDTVPPILAAEDCNYDSIVSTRDLEDWARLSITLEGVDSDIVSGNIMIGLKWVNTTNTPGIKIVTAPGNGLDYLYDTTGTAASAQFKQDPRDTNNQAASLSGQYGRLAIEDANDGHTNIIPSSAAADFVFPKWVWSDPQRPWADLTEGTATIPFLFEGTSRGEGQLQIVFLKSDGKTFLAQAGSPWLDLRDVKEMYQRAIATGAGPTYSPPSEPYVSNNSAFNASTLATSIDTNNAFQKPWDETNQCVVFTHGYYTNYDQYIDYSEAMFKRLWWQGYKGRFISYNWPALSGPACFNPSEWNAWIYGTPFMNYVTGIKSQFNTMTVVAHSQGNVVVGSAIQQGLKFDNYIMLQPAIPTGCYTSADSSGDAYNSYKPFTDAEQVTQTPNLAANLGYRNYIYPQFRNVSYYACFYNPNDFALATGSYLWGTLATNWEADQIQYKPDGSPGQSGAYWYQYTPLDAQGYRIQPNTWLAFPVTDIRESMSFVARPRSQAAGADKYSPAVFDKGIDLSQPPYNFSGELSDHSGEFERDYNLVWPLYQQFESIISPQQ